MTSEIQIFTNPEFGNIRTINENGKVLFCGKDVATALGFVNPTKAVRMHCKGGGPKRTLIDALNREQEATFISEGDVIRLILRSTLPSAEKFERWVCDEIVPSVLHTGAYALKGCVLPDFTNPAIAARAWADEYEQKCALAAKIEQDKPKVAFADAVSASDTDILIRDLAKLLRQNGYEVGEKRLFEQLRSEGYLIKAKPDWNRPTQRAMELGLFRVQERVIFSEAGEPARTAFTTRVTPKGQQYFISRYCGAIN